MNVAAPISLPLPRRTFTVEDVWRMVEAGILDEDERVELIDGELVMMAAKGFAHERIKNELVLAVARALPPHLRIGVECSLRLTENLLLEPDLAIFPRSVFDKRGTRFVSLDPGEALLVIEVAVSSLAYDKDFKSALYARHPVAEFWVVDANEQRTWVYRNPAQGSWSTVEERGPGEALTTPTLPGFSVTLDQFD